MNITILYKVSGILLPVFILIAIGIFLSHRKVLNHTTNQGLQRYIFTTAMPVMLFSAISKYSFTQIFDTQYLIAITAVFFITMGISIIVASKYFAQNDKSAIMNGLTSSFANSTYIGLAICYFAFGEEGFAPAVIYTVLTSFLLIIPILLCRFSDLKASGAKKYKTLWGNFIWEFTSNPLVIGPGLAIIFLAFDISLPETINVTLGMIARTAGPMALISIGCSLYFIYLEKSDDTQPRLKREVTFVILMKLILSPLIAYLIITPIVGMDPIWKAVFVLQTAMPSGLSTYIICTQEKVFVRRNALIILYSTVLSTITLSAVSVFYLGVNV